MSAADLRAEHDALPILEANGKPFDKARRFDQQSMICGQCHVEYYFDGKNKAVKFLWDEGMKVENMEQYYEAIAFSDWTNSLSKTPMLKAQHPEYETWSAGIHGKNNVTCIDCHMPKVQNAPVAVVLFQQNNMVLRDGTNRRVFTGEILFNRRLIQRDFPALTTVVATGRARTGKVGDKGRFSDGEFFHYTHSGIKKKKLHMKILYNNETNSALKPCNNILISMGY